MHDPTEQQVFLPDVHSLIRAFDAAEILPGTTLTQCDQVVLFNVVSDAGTWKSAFTLADRKKASAFVEAVQEAIGPTRKFISQVVTANSLPAWIAPNINLIPAYPPSPEYLSNLPPAGVLPAIDHALHCTGNGQTAVSHEQPDISRLEYPTFNHPQIFESLRDPIDVATLRLSTPDIGALDLFVTNRYFHEALVRKALQVRGMNTIVLQPADLIALFSEGPDSQQPEFQIIGFRSSDPKSSCYDDSLDPQEFAVMYSLSTGYVPVVNDFAREYGFGDVSSLQGMNWKFVMEFRVARGRLTHERNQTVDFVIST